MAANTQLGTLLRRRMGVLKGVIEVTSATLAYGTTGTHNILDEDGNALTLPSGAIIRQCYFDVVTAVTSTGSNATIALNANSAGDLLVAVEPDATGSITTGVYPGVPIGTAATMVKTTADRTLTYAVAVNPILTGKINVFVEYVLSSEVE